MTTPEANVLSQKATRRARSYIARAEAHRWWRTLRLTGELPPGFEGVRGFRRFLAETRWDPDKIGWTPVRWSQDPKTGKDFRWQPEDHKKWSTIPAYLEKHGFDPGILDA